MIDRKKALMAPDFSASDTKDRKIQLLDYRGKKNVMLVFNRGFT
jgi:peroxiredoxin